MDMTLRKITTPKELTGNNHQQMLSSEEPPTTKFLYLTNSTFKNHLPEELKLGSVVSYVGTKND
jgi:hypothetical protein